MILKSCQKNQENYKMASKKDYINQAKFFIDMIKTITNPQQQKLMRVKIEDYCSTAKQDNRRFNKQTFIDYINHGIKN